MEIQFSGLTVKKGEREILSDVWGVARPGKVLAVMGGSGECFVVLIHSPCIYEIRGWDLAEWLERCASIPKITGSNPSDGS
jgi:hypothetical protein